MRSLLWFLLGLVALATPLRAEDSVYISRAEIMLLPMSGASWESVLADSKKSVAGLTISDQNDDRGSYLFAKAMVGVRTENETLLAECRAACMSAMETENGGRTLALGRELRAIVIAADLARLSPEHNATFCNWLRGVMRETLDGRTLISTHNDRPNNWGTHAGASRIAADLYLIAHGTADQKFEAEIDLAHAVLVFQGFLGDRSKYAKFQYGDLSWQANRSLPVGINPADSFILGHPVGGVMPDDQRRGGSFEWPPPAENYVREALQGAVDQAEMLHRQGYPAFSWSDSALYRASEWLHVYAQTDFSDNGDESTVELINFRHPGKKSFPVFRPCGLTRSLGYGDWTHGPGRPSDTVPEEPPPPPPSPGLVVGPTSLTVAYEIGNPAPPDQLVNVTSDGTTELVFEVKSNQPWLTVDPTQDVTPQAVTAKINPVGLAAGAYVGTLEFTASSGSKTVSVNLTVSDAPLPPPPPPPPPDGEEPPQPTSNTIEVRIAAGSDDAEERTSGSVSLNDGDTYLVGPKENRAVLLRFDNLAIPRGAIIEEASIEFIANESHSEPCSFRITAHDTGNSPTAIAAKNNISSRPVVAHSVSWNPGPWVEDQAYRTSEFPLVVNAVTSRPDWNPGQPFSVILTQESGTGHRVAENFKRPENAAILRVKYTTP